MGTLYGSLWGSVVPLPETCPPYPLGTKIQMEDMELSGDYVLDSRDYVGLRDYRYSQRQKEREKTGRGRRA